MKAPKAAGKIKVKQNQQDGALPYGGLRDGAPRYSALRYSGFWDIGISWPGEEGAVLSVYRSAGSSKLEKVVSGYVYWYPE